MVQVRKLDVTEINQLPRRETINQPIVDTTS